MFLPTPLQLAIMTSRIASGGKIIPSIIKDKNINNQNFELMVKYSEPLKIIQKSMFKVVNEQKGTAFKSRSDSFQFSGKTGTSQVKKITLEERESEDFRKIDIEWKSRDHALFVGYMPAESKNAISVVIEHGGSGASTAAPIAKEAFNFIKKNNLS